MFYIFNAEHVCISHCDIEPDRADLASRGEYAINTDVECKLGYLNNKGHIQPPSPPQLTEEKAAQLLRRKRDNLLLEFDRKLYRNPFYWDSLSQEQRDERLAYRRALLDVPTQTGFPQVDSITWPSYPIL